MNGCETRHSAEVSMYIALYSTGSKNLYLCQYNTYNFIIGRVFWSLSE